MSIIGCTASQFTLPPSPVEEVIESEPAPELAGWIYDSVLAAALSEEMQRPVLIVATDDSNWFAELCREDGVEDLYELYVCLKTSPELCGVTADLAIGLCEPGGTEVESLPTQRDVVLLVSELKELHDERFASNNASDVDDGND